MSFATYPSLNGAVVFVTGGASGIGEQIVRAFAAQGSKIGFVDTERGGRSPMSWAGRARLSASSRATCATSTP